MYVGACVRVRPLIIVCIHSYYYSSAPLASPGLRRRCWAAVYVRSSECEGRGFLLVQVKPTTPSLTPQRAHEGFSPRPTSSRHAQHCRHHRDRQRVGRGTGTTVRGYCVYVPFLHPPSSFAVSHQMISDARWELNDARLPIAVPPSSHAVSFTVRSPGLCPRCIFYNTIHRGNMLDSV